MNAVLDLPVIIFKRAKPLVVGETEVSDDTLLVLTEAKDKYNINFFNNERSTKDNESLVTVAELFAAAEETPTSFLLHRKPIRFEVNMGGVER